MGPLVAKESNLFITVKHMKYAVLLSCLGLVACGGGAPDCNFKGKADSAPSAGCLVVHENQLLLMEGRSGFGPPGGAAEADESAQCAAERETFEESGVEVVAGELAATFDNGFHLYWCDSVGIPEPEIQRPLEVSSVGFYSHEQFPDLRWRYPQQGGLIYQMIKNR